MAILSWAAALPVLLLAAIVLDPGQLMAQSDADPDIPVLIHAAPHGTVVDSAGHPVASARIMLYHAVSSWGLGNSVEEETTTGADGGFAFSRPLRFKNPAVRHDPPEYTLFATAAGSAPTWAAVLPETPEDRVFALTLTQPKPQTFETVDKAGKPVEGATVWLRYAGKQMDHGPYFAENLLVPEDIGVCHAVTDAAGRATLENLPDTQLSVAASKAGFEDEMSCTTPRDGVPRFTLRPAGVLEGRVTDPSGNAVAGATVALFPKFRFFQYFLAKTDAGGRYRIEKIWSDLAAHPDQPDWGKYSVGLRHPLLTMARREVAFTLGQTITGFDLAAVPGTEIVGRLLDPATRAPVAGGRVYVDSAGGRQEPDTDGKGIFRCRVMPGEIRSAFIGPPRGHYVVEDDYATGPPTSVRTSVGGAQFAIELFLPGPLGKLGLVHGRVQTPDGHPAAFCTVAAVIEGKRLLLTGWTGNALRGIQADGQGNFELDGIPIGLAFTLSAQTSDGKFRGTLAGHLDTDSLDLPTPLVVTGTVATEVLLTDLDGKPRPNLKVTAVQQVAGKDLFTQRQELVSGPDGILRLPNAAPGGTYRLSVPGSQSATATFTVPAAGDATSSSRRRWFSPSSTSSACSGRMASQSGSGRSRISMSI